MSDFARYNYEPIPYHNSVSPELLTPNELWAARELARLERESEKQERRRKFLKEEIKDSLIVTRKIDKEKEALRNALRGM